MTEVTFFEDYHCFEYHTPQDAAPRFRYFLYSPVYERIAFFSRLSTHFPLAHEPMIHSGDFIPVRLAQRSNDR